MLHTNTVESATLALMSRLLALPELASFALVGGTNLSLRFGHRLSVDIDLFTNETFDPEAVWDAVRTEFPQAVKIEERGQTIVASIDGVKIDLIRHAYPYLFEVENNEGLRMLSATDVAAMKLGAAARRGSKKDFWDIARLLDLFALAEMLSSFQKKYARDDIGYVVMSLTYFDDAEAQEDPVALDSTGWEAVKKKVQGAVKGYLQSRV